MGPALGDYCKGRFSQVFCGFKRGENAFLQVILTLPAPGARESEPLPVPPAFLFLTLRRPHKDLQGLFSFLRKVLILVCSLNSWSSYQQSRKGSTASAKTQQQFYLNQDGDLSRFVNRVGYIIYIYIYIFS